jgi:integrase
MKRRKGRRARGTGSVFFSAKRGVWIARKAVGGTKVERWGRTQREAVDRLSEALPPDPDTVTVSQWAARWFETLTVRPSTRNNYRISVEHHIGPALGDVRLADLTAHHVEQFIAKLVSVVGTGTTGKIVRHLRTCLSAAVRAGLASSNPAAVAKKPRHEPAPVETYSGAELRNIIAASRRYVAGGSIATMAATGMRIGEALALDAADYDAAKGTLSITKTAHPQFGIGPPKSRHSRRTITAPDILRPVLDAARGGRDSGPLFLTSGGKRRLARKIEHGWKATCRDAGVPRRKIHTLRHSVASAMIAAGVPIADVAKYIGDKVTTVAQFYLHATKVDPVHQLNGILDVVKPAPLPLGGRKVGDKLGVDVTQGLGV